MLKFKILQEVRENSSRQYFPSYILHRQGLSMFVAQGGHPASRHKGRLSKGHLSSSQEPWRLCPGFRFGNSCSDTGDKGHHFPSPPPVSWVNPRLVTTCRVWVCLLHPLGQAVVSLSIPCPASGSHQSSLLLFISRPVCYPQPCVTD